MTIRMPDSITPGDLPRGYRAYLGYTDGEWPTADRLPELFPSARHLTLTVLGKGAVADGCDRENGDLTAAQAADWLRGRIQAGQWRPVLYASRDNVAPVLKILRQLGMQQAAIRVLSAHYGIGEHICGPLSCDAPWTADGTQWTDSFPGTGGTTIDMSTLADDFFGAITAPTPTEVLMRELPEVKQGATGADVRTVQALCVARGVITLKVDGVFGPDTAGAVRIVQHAGKVATDSVVGPLTWAVLLGA